MQLKLMQFCNFRLILKLNQITIKILKANKIKIIIKIINFKIFTLKIFQKIKHFFLLKIKIGEEYFRMFINKDDPNPIR